MAIDNDYVLRLKGDNKNLRKSLMNSKKQIHELEATVKKLSAEFKKSQRVSSKSMQGIANEIKKAIPTTSSMIKGFAAMAGVAGGVGAAVGILSGTVKKAADEVLSNV
jgi:uncharacterized protein YlxW (UPF0749 family)